MGDIVLCDQDECWCDGSTSDDEITIVLNKQTAVELARFTSTYAPLVKEVALACEVAIRRNHTSSTWSD